MEVGVKAHARHARWSAPAGEVRFGGLHLVLSRTRFLALFPNLYLPRSPPLLPVPGLRIRPDSTTKPDSEPSAHRTNPRVYVSGEVNWTFGVAKTVHEAAALCGTGLGLDYSAEG